MGKKWIKRIALGLLVAVVVVAAGYCLLRFGFSIDVLDQSGWNREKGVRYLDYWGKPQTGWQEIEGKSFYFTPEEGAMVTGWRKIDGVQYYFHEDGTLGSGWVEKDGNRFYFGEDGILVTGWLQLDGNTYYLAAEDGAMTTDWLELDGKQYYFTQEGVTVSGWVDLEGVRYRFNDDGSMLTGWFEDDTGRYFIGEDGHPQTGWLDWEQKRYFLNQDGSVTTGWMTVEQDRYYFLPSGRMAIGEVEIDGVARFFTSTGKEVLMCNPWHAIPEDFVLDLVPIEGKMIDRNAQEPLQRMMDDGRAQGRDIEINNSYRSVENQRASWKNSVAMYMEEGLSKEQAEVLVGRSLAIPGHSEHHTGLALDVNSGYKVYEWLAENCWDYGFILRYPEDKISITGIIYEPWHFRYVGTELSLELKELGICMEEYMAILTEQQKLIAD